jgi:hypothetical protein
MVEPYLNQIGGKVDNDVNLFTGGLNTYEDKAFLEGNQMPYVLNMGMYKPPMMCTRPARISLATAMPNQQWQENIGEIIEMYCYSEDRIFVIVEEDETILGITHRVRRLKEIVKESGGQYFVLPTLYQYEFDATEANREKYTFTNVRRQTDDNIYVTTPTTKIKVLLYPDHPTYDAAINMTDGHYGLSCHHKGRLFLAKPETNTIEWSNALMPDDFTIGPGGDSGEVYITSTKGSIKSIVSFDDKLVVLCEHSMHVIYGHSGVASDPNYFQVVDISNNLGCHSERCVAVGGGRMFWLGDDYEVYEYTGSAINVISRPGKTRNSTLSVGGISNIFSAEDDVDFKNRAQMVATDSKLYFNIGLASQNEFMFVFDVYNRTWWCEDGVFTAIANYSSHINSILMARPNGDIVRNYERMDVWSGESNDRYYDFDVDSIVSVPIRYEFHTRVYGADGMDMRKTISEVWFQARANASVYINDIWTSHDKWAEELGGEWYANIDENYRKIGDLKFEQQPIQDGTTPEKYNPHTYEQQVCYVEKMYGQRLNAFQVIVKGTGRSQFYLMKRVWRAQ